MSPGDVVLISLRQLGSTTLKLRPALLLADLPGPYQNRLVCGISTQLHLLQANWDELLQTADADFPTSGLHRSSAIRLSFLYAADTSELVGIIGKIDSSRLERLRRRLSDHLRP